MTIHAQVLGTGIFVLAVLNTFSTRAFQQLSVRFRKHSIQRNLFHLLGEIETVFGFWAGIFLILLPFVEGKDLAIEYLTHLDFTEPLFVFAVMAVTATQPVVDFTRSVLEHAARWVPLPSEAAFFFSTLALGPLLGSLITEPAAMTVTALVLRDRYFSKRLSSKAMYLTLGTLFVNISIGGALTPFAAPPILLVARSWQWDFDFMLRNFAWKAGFATIINACLVTAFCFQELKAFPSLQKKRAPQRSPLWLQLIHLFLLFLIVATSHHAVIFLGIFLFCWGLVKLTKEIQGGLKIRQSFLVALFLAGLVVLGSQQSWWLGPLIQELDSLSLFLGSIMLTSVTDNAALTYLGSQIPTLSPYLRYFLVAGAITGGGLTVLANAPNPAGYAILRDTFGSEGIRPLKLFGGAAIPTFIAAVCFWFL